MNKYEKSLDRIKKRVEIGGNWTDEDIEHYKTIVEALTIAAEVKHGEWLDREGKIKAFDEFKRIFEKRCLDCGIYTEQVRKQFEQSLDEMGVFYK